MSPSKAFLDGLSAYMPHDGRFHHILGPGICHIGFDECGSAEEPAFYINSIEVDPAHRFQGIGSRVLAQVAELADNYGVDLFLNALASGPLSDPDLIEWYRRHGFEVTDTFPEFDGQAMHRRHRPTPQPDLS